LLKTTFIVSGCNRKGEYLPEKEVRAGSAYEAATRFSGESIIPDSTGHTRRYREFQTALGGMVSTTEK
jgi:hypothetical protein